MTRFASIVGIGVAIGFLFLVWANQAGIAQFGSELGGLLLMGLRLSCGVTVAVVAVGLWWWIDRHNHAKRRMVDGAWALQVYNELPLTMRIVNWLQGKPSPLTVYDHNLNATPHAVIYRGVNIPDATPAQLQYAESVERTNRTRAAVTGDGVKGLPWFAPESSRMSAPAARLAAGAYDKPPRLITAEPTPALTAPTPQLLKLGDALNQARPDHWLAGQNLDSGQVAAFDPVRHVHCGIVGSTGTGKTTSVGFCFVAQALRTGYHVAILDPKEADWKLWANHCEWMESDPSTFGDQVQAIWNEHERRAMTLRDSNAANVRLLPSPPAPVLVLIEEYGDLIALMRRTNRKAADATDATLDRLMRLSRATDIHLCLVDQYPEEWSPQVMAGASRWLATFQLAPGQGAKVGEYKADQLPPNGQFLHKAHTYDSWFVRPDVFPQLLQRTPASTSPRVIDGQCTPVHSDDSGQFVAPVQEVHTRVDPTPAQFMNSVNLAPTTVEGWYEWTLDNYLPTHTELLQTDNGRGVGIKALAETMALQNGKDYEAMKGTASEVAKRLRASVMLPTGDRLGTDISKGAL